MAGNNSPQIRGTVDELIARFGEIPNSGSDNVHNAILEAGFREIATFGGPIARLTSDHFPQGRIEDLLIVNEGVLDGVPNSKRYRVYVKMYDTSLSTGV